VKSVDKELTDALTAGKESSVYGSNLSQISFEGSMPGVPARDADRVRAKIAKLLSDVAWRNGAAPFQLIARYGAQKPSGEISQAPQDLTVGTARDDKEQRMEFVPIEPNYQLEQLVVPVSTRERLLDCIEFVKVSPVVFGTWGLRSIEPHPSIAVNFRGPPGTGKTMAAHAAASYLGKKILLSRLSDLESKYYGQGPKNLAALFESAQRENAIIFIDEAESLLSRRFAQPEQAAESSINSMRTELLMALDSFDGLVIFASNLPNSYDEAIDSRLLHVDFELPDFEARRAIWQLHLPSSLPVDPSLSIDNLSAVDGVSGRDIKLAVISAAVSAARHNAPHVTEGTLRLSLERQRRGLREGEAKVGAPAPEVAEAVQEGIERSQQAATATPPRV
jgi:SpoVK/Ycf46/Vps4 family AAA+-type ATPase